MATTLEANTLFYQRGSKREKEYLSVCARYRYLLYVLPYSRQVYTIVI